MGLYTTDHGWQVVHEIKDLKDKKNSYWKSSKLLPFCLRIKGQWCWNHFVKTLDDYYKQNHFQTEKTGSCYRKELLTEPIQSP